MTKTTDHETTKARATLAGIVAGEIAASIASGHAPVTLRGVLEMTRDGHDAIGSGTVTGTIGALDFGVYATRHGTIAARECKIGAEIGSLGMVPMFLCDSGLTMRIRPGDRLVTATSKLVVTD